MKCVKSLKQPQVFARVNDNEAQVLVDSGKWVYCPKSEWKKHRDNKID